MAESFWEMHLKSAIQDIAKRQNPHQFWWGFASQVGPARFERATYALEALKMRLNNTKHNPFKVLAFGVQ